MIGAAKFIVKSSWTSPPGRVQLGTGQLHVWCADMADFHSRLQDFRAILSDSEITRAERFKFPNDRDHYCVRHGIRRLLLARYLRVDPVAVEFQHGARGKPEFAGRSQHVHFNDSHSGELALYAVAADCPIGVDIEQVKPVPDFEAIAENYFSPREVAAMRALPSGQRMEAFYSCWTRKEALLKATGEGIGTSLPKVEVTLGREEDPAVLSIDGDQDARLNWSLRAFCPAAGYVGAAAFARHNLELIVWRITNVDSWLWGEIRS